MLFHLTSSFSRDGSLPGLDPYDRAGSEGWESTSPISPTPKSSVQLLFFKACKSTSSSNGLLLRSRWERVWLAEAWVSVRPWLRECELPEMRDMEALT